MKILFQVLLMWLSLPALAVELLDTPPDFTLKAMSGDNLRLEEHRGQVILVNFWASWCGPCRQEMPILDQIHDRYSDMGFTVLGVNVDKDPKKARRIADQVNVSFPLLLDEKQKVSKTWDVSAMPYTVLIDRDGQVQYIHRGYKSGDEAVYIDRLRALLRGSRGAD